ncbi:MAG: Rpn family recombination-promoting nuclease/putative transposase [Cyanothece sp. SIO2G6]|nr:Rpn family recombination-promoting nuclease/putative transposase [Cyanothece sp. SIO2G6]
MAFSLQERYINLLTDFGFKRVFGSEPHKSLLVDFLNTLLPAHHQITDLSYKNSENVGNTPIDRKAIFDIYCQGMNGERFIVEIQKAKQNYFKDRSVYYASFPIQEQALKGEWNYRLEPVYSIGVLDFTFDDHEKDPAYIHTVGLKDQKCQVFYDKLTFIYIELPKYTKSVGELTNHQDKWLYLLRHLPELDDRPAPFQDSVFLELFEIAEIANFSSDEQETYERSLKYYRDLNNVVNTSKDEGIEIGEKRGIEIGEKRGIEIGEKRGIEIGEKRGIAQGKRSLLIKLLSGKLGELPPELVSQINNLTPEKLDTLGEEMFNLETLTALQEWLTQ